MRKLCSTVFASVFMMLAGHIQAAPTTYTFNSTIASADSPLLGLYAVGSAVNGSFTLDDSVLPVAGTGNWYYDSLSGQMAFTTHTLNFDGATTQVLNSGSHGVASLLAGSFWNTAIQSDANIDGLALVGLNLFLTFKHTFDASLPIPGANLITDPAELIGAQLGIIYYGGSGTANYAFANVTEIHTARSSAVSEPDVPGLIVAGLILLYCRHRANVRAREEH